MRQFYLLAFCVLAMPLLMAMDSTDYTVADLKDAQNSARFSCVKKVIALDYLSTPYSEFDEMLTHIFDSSAVYWTDLNADSRADFILKLQSPLMCGARNCPTLVFTAQSDDCEFSKALEVSIGGEIRILNTVQNSFKNIEFWGGGYSYIKEQPLYSYDAATKRYECQNCDIIKKQIK